MDIEKKEVGKDKAQLLEVAVKRSKKLRLSRPLEKDERYRVRIDTYAKKKPKFHRRTDVGFRLVTATSAETADGGATRKREDDPRAFIKNV